MKLLNYLLCCINTALIVMITVELAKMEMFATLWTLAFLVPMNAFEWYVTLRNYKKRK